jgi:nicotinamidase-related amidase
MKAKAAKREVLRRASVALRAVVATAALAAATSACGAQAAETVPTKATPEQAAVKWRGAKGTALLVIDMQEAYLPILFQARVLAAVKTMVARAEAAGATVVWVYNQDEVAKPGTPLFELHPSLKPEEGHLSIVKTSSSSFYGTELEKMLDERGIGKIVVCGLASNYCVNATVEGARSRGYWVIVAKDAHSVPKYGGSAKDVEGMNKRWSANSYADVLPSSEIAF